MALAAPTALGGSSTGLGDQHFPEEMIERVQRLDDRTDIVGERCVITAPFCGMQGSTSATEAKDPEPGPDLMVRALEEMIAPIHMRDGFAPSLAAHEILAVLGGRCANVHDPNRVVPAGQP